MTYLSLSAVFVVVSLLFLVAVVATAPRRRALVARWWRPILAAGVALMVLTAIFDNVMIAIGLIAYEPTHLVGVLIGLAPIEDFTYPLAGLLFLPALWLLLGRRRRTDDRE